ncbi:hypothetical protein KUTeg_000438 [Tegillarca granosa]|uniref:Fibrinogen C-terminal domain-containing protein n=1 Tax=Tegillarca granosa TaxID=220873 RepID=A0ABQ9FXI2_TEGGR|nr:hypothetical protein KUTeg_000438 [Tegillarca granosa]
MVTYKQLLLLLIVAIGCQFQEILPQGRQSCVDRNVDFLMQEMKKMKDDIRELKSRVMYLEKNRAVQKDCLGWYKFGMREDGIFRISPDGEHSFEVNCDMVNGGWTIIQQRIDGYVSFDRLWVDYKIGFGNLSSDHWIGLENIHLLTKQSAVHISFEIGNGINRKFSNCSVLWVSG